MRTFLNYFLEKDPDHAEDSEMPEVLGIRGSTPRVVSECNVLQA